MRKFWTCESAKGAPQRTWSKETILSFVVSTHIHSMGMASNDKRGPKIGDSASLWNFTLVPGKWNSNASDQNPLHPTPKLQEHIISINGSHSTLMFGFRRPAIFWRTSTCYKCLLNCAVVRPPHSTGSSSTQLCKKHRKKYSTMIYKLYVSKLKFNSGFSQVLRASGRIHLRSWHCSDSISGFRRVGETDGFDISVAQGAKQRLSDEHFRKKWTCYGLSL